MNQQALCIEMWLQVSRRYSDKRQGSRLVATLYRRVTVRRLYCEDQESCRTLPAAAKYCAPSTSAIKDRVSPVYAIARVLYVYALPLTCATILSLLLLCPQGFQLVRALACDPHAA